MLEQAVCTEQTLPAAPLQSIPTDFAVPERLSAMGRMIALISHDLRLPLTVILANAEFLTRSEISGIERNEFYLEIRWAVDRMNEMISTLFECSRNCDRLRPAARNIIDTVERAIRMTCVRQKYRHVMITHRHKGHAVAWFDSSGLERVIANLVLNACEAVSPDSGQVVITTIGSQASLEICVWDNGPGIPPNMQESLFRPFVSHGKAKGSGLGLAIAKKIVEDHGGEIRLDERDGTLFRIAIPTAHPLVSLPPIGSQSDTSVPSA